MFCHQELIPYHLTALKMNDSEKRASHRYLVFCPLLPRPNVKMRNFSAIAEIDGYTKSVFQNNLISN
jgi:hypothetical protein